MKVEALNCPNCGAGVASNSTECRFCATRLKTFACPKCLGLMFIGSEHCTHCGAKTLPAETFEHAEAGDCPRCGIKLNLLNIGEVAVQECTKCGGMWSSPETFESICADGEKQSAVLGFAGREAQSHPIPTQISYVPCPVCKQLMNRSNFARSSGVIIDHCKQHGVWFDAEELPKIIAFIRKGGMEKAREREKLDLKEERDRLRSEQLRSAVRDNRFNTSKRHETDDSPLGGIIGFLFDV